MRDPKSFKNLIVGCGFNCEHHFNIADNNTINSNALHPKSDYFHISLNEFGREGNVDLNANILAKNTLLALNEHRFDFIVFETTTGLFESYVITKTIKTIKQLLSNNGICFIYAGSRDNKSRDQLSKAFDFSYLIEVGTLPIWSMIVSNQKFDLKNLMNDSSYVNIMLSILANKTNFSLETCFFSSIANQHIYGQECEKIDYITTINPFEIPARIYNTDVFLYELQENNSDSQTKNVSSWKRFR